MQLQHTMYAPRVGVQVTVNTATVARTCLNPGLGGARRARRSQEEQGGARRSEGEPGGARKSQKRPGGARTRRGEEEPVAALLTHTCCSADARHCTHCHLDCLASVGIGGWLFSTHKSLGSRLEDRCFILHRCLLSDQAALSDSPVTNTQQKGETANTKTATTAKSLECSPQVAENRPETRCWRWLFSSHQRLGITFRQKNRPPPGSRWLLKGIQAWIPS